MKIIFLLFSGFLFVFVCLSNNIYAQTGGECTAQPCLCDGTCTPDAICIADLCGGGGCSPVNCPAGTMPDWTHTTQACQYSWARTCGNRVTLGGSGCSAYCRSVRVGCDTARCTCKAKNIILAECVPIACPATQPVITSVTSTSQTSVTLKWTPGTNGTSQQIYGSSNQVLVENTDASVLVLNTTNTLLNEYSITGLTPGIVYYFRIVNATASCSTPSNTFAGLSSCGLSTNPVVLTLGNTTTYTSPVSYSSLVSVTYSGGGGYFSVDPTSDNTSPSYSTNLTGETVSYPASSPLTSTFYIAGNPNPACVLTTPVYVLALDAWWRVIDSDVTGNNITSRVPIGFYFGLKGVGGYSGVPAYGSTTNLTSDNVSQDRWIAQSTVVGQKNFNYQYFKNMAPETVIWNAFDPVSPFSGGIVSSDGYYWYKYTGTGNNTLNISQDIDIADQKVILFVEGANLNIAGKINLIDGEGFFLTVVNGNITVDPSVSGSYDVATPELEGIYIADESFSTGLGATPIHIRGSIVGYTGVNLQRDLGTFNGIFPGESLEYAPDQILLFPAKLGYRKINWKEVAP